MKNVLFLHGPNLNLLGTREISIYGKLTLKKINQQIREAAKKTKVSVKIFQSNGEGELINILHSHRHWADGVVINPAAYTHYSYALRDAIAGIGLPTVEVHLSDIKKREPFRRKSVIKAVCIGQVSGLGPASYTEGLKLLLKKLEA